MQRELPSTWHDLTASEAANRLEVDPRQGLSEAEVGKRRAQFGPNRLKSRREKPGWLKFLLQFHQALVYILLLATAVSAFLGEWVDAGVIFAVVFVNAIVGFIQENKAARALEALSKLVKNETTVRREGRKMKAPSESLVPGDVVLLQAGDAVPADMRLTDIWDAQIEEAALTGESVPSLKRPDPLPPGTPLGDRANIAFAGTLVIRGQAEGVVVATGQGTETGRIATLIDEAAELSTPLTRKIAAFSRLLLYAILILSGVAFAVGVARGEPWPEMFMVAIALAVGAIPEGLPAAVTITLAIGVGRMAGRHAIIRHLPAVETLGSTTVICSDKTGTLTENQMTVNRIYAGGAFWTVTGSGYEEPGEVRNDQGPADLANHAALRECLTAGLLCNDSQLVRKDGRLQVEGDPTEASLIVSARKAGLDQADLNRRYPRRNVIPFDSRHMYMATLHEDRDGQRLYLKGSVERLLDRCHTVLDAQGRAQPLEKESIRQAIDGMTAQGLRVLALATHCLPHGQDTLHHGHVERGLTLLGLQGMIDPPRSEAIRAVAKCRTAGIAVKMITGDHKGTATAVAAALGLGEGDGASGPAKALTGVELERVPDSDLPKTAEQTAVFARVAPEQKLRLVRALQQQGHIVAMTGDGVNDAPALKQADIGVAMGITGTDAAKSVADMILADDNFASIEAAVEEGRTVFDNLTKFIAWTLPTNGGLGLIVMGALFLGLDMPILPVQLLWINLATSLLLGLTLAFEPGEKAIMTRAPRKPQEPLLTRALIHRIALVSAVMLAASLVLFILGLRKGQSLDQLRTMTVNVVVVVEMFYLLNCRSLTGSLFSLRFFSNPWVPAGLAAMAGMQALFTYAPFMNRLFHSAPLDGATWLEIGGVGLVVFLLIEGWKAWIARRRRAVSS